MRTRSKPAKAKVTTKDTEEALKPLPVPDENPPKLFILPKGLSKDARIVTLANPRTFTPTRYYYCPETGIHEIKHIADPASAARSLLMVPQSGESELEELNEEASGNDVQLQPDKGYVLKSASFYAVTPIDPLFLVLPTLSPKPKTTNSNSEVRILFLPIDDILENLFELSKHLRYLTLHAETRVLLEDRIVAVCDSVEAGDERMFRLNHDKLLHELLAKAERMVEGGLPPSMEERFVRKALDVPMASLLMEEETAKLKKEESSADFTAVEFSQTESGDSQSTNASATSTNSQSSMSTSLTVPTPVNSQPTVSAGALQPTDEIIRLLRLRTALSFILSAYVPKHLASKLESLLSRSTSSTAIDFAPLTEHLAKLSTLRIEAAAHTLVQAAGGSYKRTFDEDEGAEEKAEKRRKKEEEEKKKKLGESRGVRDLKKVNTTGMKKMSDFFKKK